MEIKASVKSLPQGWAMYKSKRYPGQMYYFNSLTGCTSWELPDAMNNDQTQPKSWSSRENLCHTRYSQSIHSGTKKQCLSSLEFSPNCGHQYETRQSILATKQNDGLVLDTPCQRTDAVKPDKRSLRLIHPQDKPKNDCVPSHEHCLGHLVSERPIFQAPPLKQKQLTNDQGLGCSSSASSLNGDAVCKKKRKRCHRKNKGNDHETKGTVRESVSKDNLNFVDKKLNWAKKVKRQTAAHEFQATHEKRAAREQLIQFTDSSQEQFKNRPRLTCTGDVKKSASSDDPVNLNQTKQARNVRLHDSIKEVECDTDASCLSLFYKKKEECDSIACHEYEDMEVDDDNQLLLDLQEIRENLKPADPQVHIDLMESVQKNVSQSSPSSSSCSPQALYVVVDTNILIQSLRALEQLKDGTVTGFEHPVVVIPWIVMQELDSLKGDNKLQKSCQLQAKKAVNYLHTCFVAHHPRVRGQTPAQACEKVDDFPVECNDDHILLCCLQLQKKYTDAKVILLTNDKNLHNKAIVLGLECLNSKSLIPLLTDISSESVPASQLKEPPKTIPLHDKGDTDERILVDNLVCELKSALKSCLSPLVEQELAEVYGNIWTDIVCFKPPWSVLDLLSILLKHWRAVFYLLFPKQMESVAENLLHLFRAPIKDLQQVKELVDVCMQLVHIIRSKKKYVEICNKTEETFLLLQEKSGKEKCNSKSSHLPSVKAQEQTGAQQSASGSLNPENDDNTEIFSKSVIINNSIDSAAESRTMRTSRRNLDRNETQSSLAAGHRTVCTSQPNLDSNEMQSSLAAVSQKSALPSSGPDDANKFPAMSDVVNDVVNSVTKSARVNCKRPTISAKKLFSAGQNTQSANMSSICSTQVDSDVIYSSRKHKTYSTSSPEIVMVKQTVLPCVSEAANICTGQSSKPLHIQSDVSLPSEGRKVQQNLVASKEKSAQLIQDRFQNVWSTIFNCCNNLESRLDRNATLGKEEAVNISKTLEEFVPAVKEIRSLFEECLAFSPMGLERHINTFNKFCSCLNNFYLRTKLQSEPLSAIRPQQMIAFMADVKNRVTLLNGLRQLDDMLLKLWNLIIRLPDTDDKQHWSS